MRRILSEGPVYPNDRAFFWFGLVGGFLNLTIDLFGSLLLSADPYFLAFLAAGLGSISFGTGEMLPPGSRKPAVTLRLVSLLMFLVFTVLLLVGFFTSLQTR